MAVTGELGWEEYAVVLTSLVATTSVGLYFSRYGQGSLDEYMLGGKKMTLLPISLSIAATCVNGITLTSLAVETYLFGAQPTFLAFSVILSAFLTTTFYLPVLHQFKNVSSFQYFDLRFNRHVRKVASAVFIFEAIQQSSICTYVTAAAFSEASGVPVPQIALVLSLVCVACSALGGLKSVAWSDAVQALIIIFCTSCFFFLGITKAGGVVEVVHKIQDGGRWEFFNFDLSLYTRYTVWGSLMGSSTISSAYNFSPAFHQRYISLPSYQLSKRAIWLGAIVSTWLFYVCWGMGLVVYAFYAGCDPVLAKKGLQSYSMIVPYFVAQVTRGLPGLAGLFYASVIAGGVSTITSYWNTVSCTTYEDFIPSKWKYSNKNSYRILVLLLLMVAVVSGFGVFLASNFSNLFQASMAFRGASHSSFLVLYNAALFLPWVNATGVVAGVVTAALFALTSIVGGIRAQHQGLLQDVPKLLTTRYCNETFDNSTILTLGTTDYGIQKLADPSVFWMFKISLCFHALVGTLIGIVVAVAVSFLAGSQSLSTLNPKLIVPQMRWVFPPKVEGEDADTVNAPMLKDQSTNTNGQNDATELTVQVKHEIPSNSKQ